jgi:hypothetical protein
MYLAVPSNANGIVSGLSPHDFIDFYTGQFMVVKGQAQSGQGAGRLPMLQKPGFQIELSLIP